MAESQVQVNEGTGKGFHTWSRTIGSTVQDEVVILGEPYLPSYNIVGTSALITTANSHLLQIMAGASLNVRIRRVRVYQTAVFTTLALFSMQMFRLTTAGSGGTVLTPRPKNTADTAGMSAMSLPTVKGTEGAQIDEATFVAVAAVTAGHVPLVWEWTEQPNVQPWIIPAGVTNGIAFKNPLTQAAGQLRVIVEADESSFL